MRPLLGLDRFQLFEPLAVEATDDPGIADRDVEPPKLGVLHDDVRDARQGQARQDRAGHTVEHDERSAVCRAEETRAVEPEAVRTRSWHLEARLELATSSVENEDQRRLADVRVDDVTLRVVERPARTTGQRQKMNEQPISAL